MWQYTNEYEDISNLIDHKIEKEQELILFFRLLKRNLNVFTFVMSFFLMMEPWDPWRIRLDNGYAVVQSHNLDPELEPLDSELFSPLVDWFEPYGWYSYSNYYSPTFMPRPRKDKKPTPIYIYPPPNWALLRPQHNGPLFQVYCRGFCGCF